MRFKVDTFLFVIHKDWATKSSIIFIHNKVNFFLGNSFDFFIICSTNVINPTALENSFSTNKMPQTKCITIVQFAFVTKIQTVFQMSLTLRTKHCSRTWHQITKIPFAKCYNVQYGLMWVKVGLRPFAILPSTPFRFRHSSFSPIDCLYFLCPFLRSLQVNFPNSWISEFFTAQRSIVVLLSKQVNGFHVIFQMITSLKYPIAFA